MLTSSRTAQLTHAWSSLMRSIFRTPVILLTVRSNMLFFVSIRCASTTAFGRSNFVESVTNSNVVKLISVSRKIGVGHPPSSDGRTLTTTKTFDATFGV